jgi:hypothetical protein
MGRSYRNEGIERWLRFLHLLALHTCGRTSAFGLIADSRRESDQMRVNIENMLRQIASAVHRSPYGYAFMLGELSKHLRQLRDRTEAGDSTALDEFFRLYVFDDQKEYARAGLETKSDEGYDANGSTVVPKGHFWRGVPESSRHQCRNCGHHYDKHHHTDEASRCPL